MSTCVGWYLQCRDSVTLATFWDNIFPVLQWHFKNSVFTSKRHPLALWQSNSVVAEQRNTHLRISSGCISSCHWLWLLSLDSPLLLDDRESAHLGSTHDTIKILSYVVNIGEMSCILSSKSNSSGLCIPLAKKWVWPRAIAIYVSSDYYSMFKNFKTETKKRKERNEAWFVIIVSFFTPHFKITNIEKECEEANHGLFNSPIPSLVSSSPDKMQLVLGFSLQPQALFYFQEDWGPSVLPEIHQGVRTIERWQHGEHVPCYFNLCLWERLESCVHFLF